MLKRQRLFLSLALSVAFGLMANESRAELISMTLSIGGGGSLVIDSVPGVFPGATSYNVTGNAGPGNYPGTLALGTINSFLAAGGSQYQFTAIGGASNFPGSPLPANLTLTGEIHAIATGGANPVLTLTETESGFTQPPAGFPGFLSSSSSGNFTNQVAGGGHSAFSIISIPVPPTAVQTATYTVLSTGTSVNSGVTTGPKSLSGTVPALYTLTNVIRWGIDAPGLSHPAAGGPDIIDTFGVTTQVSVIPEPASLVVMMMGLPFPLVVMCLLRRRRALA